MQVVYTFEQAYNLALKAKGCKKRAKSLGFNCRNQTGLALQPAMIPTAQPVEQPAMRLAMQSAVQTLA